MNAHALIEAQFINPFVGVQPADKLDERELSRALRQALSAEEEAVHFYEALADATDHAKAKAVLQSVADEEKVHIGEFQRLLEILDPEEAKHLEKGAEEVDAQE